MRKFETLLLLSPELAADAREALLGTFTGVIERAGGRFTADHWGMRDLAYPVRKQMRGYFVRLEYVAPGDTVAELERIIRISDGAFKFLTVKLADAAEEVARLYHGTRQDHCPPYHWHLRQAPAPALHRDQARPSDGSAVLHRRPFL